MFHPAHRILRDHCTARLGAQMLPRSLQCCAVWPPTKDQQRICLCEEGSYCRAARITTRLIGELSRLEQSGPAKPPMQEHTLSSPHTPCPEHCLGQEPAARARAAASTRSSNVRMDALKPARQKLVKLVGPADALVCSPAFFVRFNSHQGLKASGANTYAWSLCTDMALYSHIICAVVVPITDCSCFASV